MTDGLEPSGALVRSLRAVVGASQVLTGSAAAGYTVDWTGHFRGHTPAVVRPADAEQVAAVLRTCAAAGVPVVPQGGNTGLVGGGVPLAGEVVLSLTRLTTVGPIDFESLQVDVGAGTTLAQVSDLHPELDLGVQIASRHTATVGGAVATNAGGVRVLRYGSMRAQIRGIEAILSDGSEIAHMSGLTKDNTGYDYPSLLSGSEGTLAVITRVRLQLVERPTESTVVLVGLPGLTEAHRMAHAARRTVPGIVSAEFFTDRGLAILITRAGLNRPLSEPAPTYLLLEAAGPAALADLGALVGDAPVAVGRTPTERAKLWSYRERHPEAAGFLGAPIKLDVSVPASAWVRLASTIESLVASVDPAAEVILFGHIADNNVHINIVPGAPADGRHEEAVFGFVAELGGSISAEHGVGALKAPSLHLVRSDTERALFGRVRRAFDPAGILNPNVFPR